MMTNLIEVLKEQASFGFTGKVNVLSSTNGQFLGVVYQQEGFVVGSQFKESKGRKALFKLIFEDVEAKENFKFIVEPELVTDDVITMKESFEEIKNDVQLFFQEYLNAKKLKPAAHLKLIIDPEVIVSKEEITPEEYDLLLTLTEWCKVSDVYKYSNLMDFEVTRALVSLRKKRAIKVFQN